MIWTYLTLVVVIMATVVSTTVFCVLVYNHFVTEAKRQIEAQKIQDVIDVLDGVTTFRFTHGRVNQVIKIRPVRNKR